MILKYILAIVCLLFALGGNPSITYAEQVFFSSLQDIPLMTGLEELEEHSISFDKPEGRIIESLAIMNNITEQQVLDFYQATLPQFGWGAVGDNSFFRKNEFLSVNFEESNGMKIVKITIKPTL